MSSRETKESLSKHPDSVRMLVLETDEAHPETQQEIGSMGAIMRELFLEAGEKHDPKLGVETRMHFVPEPDGGRVPEPEELQDTHAILITGSRYDAHGDDEWILKLINLIRCKLTIADLPPKWVLILHLGIWVNRPDIKLTGICFGHQILCRTLGAKIKPNPEGEWELSHTPVELTEVGRKLFNLPESETRIHLHQMHLDHVIDAPSHGSTDLLEPGTRVHVWGQSEHTKVQGVYIQGRLFTSQGHMEFDDKMVKRQLEMRVKSGAVKKDDADEASEKAHWMHDGLRVAQAVLRFFHGDDDAIVA
jgi:GMP synthase-like glutamine amidotransferase